MSYTTRILHAAALGVLVAGFVATPASAQYEPAGGPDGAWTGVVDRPIPTVGCFRRPNSTPGASQEHTIVSGGLTRSYILHLPADYRPSRPLPVVLAFHGRKGTGTQIEGFTGISALHAIAVYPQGLPGVEDKTAWQGAPYASSADDVLFVSDLLTELQRTLCVDPARIFVTGKSNGGGFAGVLACRLSRRIAAVAPVAGAFYAGGEAGCDPRRAVPILDFHGTADSIVNYAGEPDNGLPALSDWLGAWATRDGCDAAPETIFEKDDVTAFEWPDCRGRAEVVHYRITGGGHTWPGELADSGPGHVTQTISATAVMWDFFLDHPLRRW